MTPPPTASQPDAAELHAAAHGGQTLILRIRLLAAMGVSAAIFWYVGWWVAGPIDPQGPVSLLMLDQGIVSVAELLGLAVVASGLAVAICGAGSAARGPLAIAVGLATLGLRGSQLDALVLYRMSPPAGTAVALDPFPVWALISETWLWLALIGVGFVVGRWVEGWFAANGQATPAGPTRTERTSDVRQGMGTIAATTLVAWAVLSFTTGSDVHAILKGQVYFSTGASFLFGALVSHWILRTSSCTWTLVAVAVVAGGAYVFGQPEQTALAAARDAGTYVNLSSMARPLPLEFAALGAIGVLMEGDAMRFFRALFGLGTPASRTD